MKKMLGEVINKIKSSSKVISIKNVLIKNIQKVSAIAVGIIVFVPKIAYATPNPGQAASTWFLDQAFPIALAITVGIAVMFVLRKNAIKMLTTLCIGGFVCAIIKQPTLIQTVGTDILEIIGLSS